MNTQPRTEVIGERRVNWWLVLGGAALVVFAVCTFVAPMLFLEFLTVWAGVSFLFSAVMGFVTYVKAALDLAMGILIIMHPIAFAPVLPWLLGVFFIIFGVLEMVGTAPLRQYVPESRIIMIISAILTVVVGIMFIIWPASLSIWVAAFALIRGISLIVGGFTTRIE